MYVAISYHGFGHIAQTGPIVNALRSRIPDLPLVIRCAAPLALLQSHFRGSFEHISAPVDDAMQMANSLDVLVPASYAAYTETHRQWRRRVRFEARGLRELRPFLVLANIPYLPLAAATEAGIPALALCSLNWGEVFYHYCRGRPETEAISREINTAYAGAGVFLNPEPSMPMPGLSNCRAVGPISRIGSHRKAEIAARLGIDPGDKLVLLFLGGIPTPVRFTEWRIPRGVVLFVSGTDIDRGHTVYPIEAAGVSYIDVVASADALITKPGYGSFVEAACNGDPGPLHPPPGLAGGAIRSVGWRATRGAGRSSERNWNGDGSPMPSRPYGRNPSGRRSRPRVSKRPRPSSLPISTRRKPSCPSAKKLPLVALWS